jgi:glycosyltransferase involved in cell wall biosynthesis
MKISLIILTYNRPDTLELVLKSLSRQSVNPDEVIIADDGSVPETRELISRWQALSSFRLVHVWHEDLGYRIAAIRNKATLESAGDYLIYSDGDLLLHPDFIHDFKKYSAPETAWIGSRVFLSRETTERLLSGDRASFTWSLFSPAIAANRLNGLRAPCISSFFPPLNNTMHMRGGLLGVWKEDLLAVNGWNEEFTGWGMEDTELITRLFYSGVTIRKLKFAAQTYHLWHPVSDRESLDRNKELLENTNRNRLKWCENGILKK